VVGYLRPNAVDKKIMVHFMDMIQKIVKKYAKEVC
jgi:hypothetical protein